MAKRIVAISGIDPALGQEQQGPGVGAYLATFAVAVVFGAGAVWMFMRSMQPAPARRRRR